MLTPGPENCVWIVGKLDSTAPQGSTVGVTVLHESWIYRKVARCFWVTFQSTRANSSRQLVGCDGAELKTDEAPDPPFAAGIIASRAAELGSMGTVLLGKGCLVDGSTGQSSPA